jgi:hypothetical protein
MLLLRKTIENVKSFDSTSLITSFCCFRLFEIFGTKSSLNGSEPWLDYLNHTQFLKLDLRLLSECAKGHPLLLQSAIAESRNSKAALRQPAVLRQTYSPSALTPGHSLTDD